MISETECGLDCARAVKLYQGSIGEPWLCSDEDARKRLMQCVNGTAGRHFEIDWYPIVLRVVIAHDGEDLVEPIIAEARYQARRDRERDDPMREPARQRVHRARPGARVQRGAA